MSDTYGRKSRSWQATARSSSDPWCRKPPVSPRYLNPKTVILNIPVRGTAITSDQALAGRIVAGSGGAGITALVSVIITGTPAATLDKAVWTSPLIFYRPRVSWPRCGVEKLCQPSLGAE